MIRTNINVPPEKYYEACITYNLVRDFDERINKKLYPFSISQLEESRQGYDFGYKISSLSFLVQYKRPYVDLTTEVYNWKICREQLLTFSRSNISLKKYYALPYFVDHMNWYEGLELTYFIQAADLHNLLSKKGKQKTNTINSKLKILKEWDQVYRYFLKNRRNVAYSMDTKEPTIDEILDELRDLDSKSKQSTWIYMVKR